MAYTSLSGSKLRQKLGSSLNENVSAPTSDFAQNALKKMGWQEGQGLGKKRDGISSHITVTKRQDEVGLGHSDVSQDTNQWWKDSLSDTLSKLGSKKKKKKRKQKEYTDEELFEATGGARFGMRAQRRATAKWARTESQTEDDEREAREKIEWNGRGNAEVKLAEGEDRPKKKRRKNDTESSSNSSDKEVKSEALEAKQKKKKSKKQNKKSSKKAKREKKLKESSANDESS